MVFHCLGIVLVLVWFVIFHSMIRFCLLQSKENAVLLENLERRKRELHEHRQALEQDVWENIFFLYVI